MPRKAKQASSPEAPSHIVLTEASAIAIFYHKLFLLRMRPRSIMKNRAAVRLAAMYGVTPKTIRDIWNRRSWTTVTFHLWPAETPCEVPLLSESPNLMHLKAPDDDPFYHDWPFWHAKIGE